LIIPYFSKDKLQQHEVKHDASVRMNQCQVCSKTFVRPEHLRHHTIIKHSHQYPIRYVKYSFIIEEERDKTFFYFLVVNIVEKVFFIKLNYMIIISTIIQL